MAATQTAVFTVNGNWTCPTGVTAVFILGVGGGAGTPGSGDTGSFLGTVGGAGSAELVVGRVIPVVPTTIYPVVVGTKGTGSAYNVQPIAPTASTFNGFTILPAGGYAFPRAPSNSGAGGGCGGSTGFIAGLGFNPKGTRESCCYTGGGGGSGGGAHVDAGGVHGGPQALKGTGTASRLGGYGAGTLWGGTNGGDAGVTTAPASATHYGAGAGGTYEPASGTVSGSDGAPGYVVLMWTA